jgi:hypothetical protein
MMPGGWPVTRPMPKLRTEAPSGRAGAFEHGHLEAALDGRIGVRQAEDAGTDHGQVKVLRIVF